MRTLNPLLAICLLISCGSSHIKKDKKESLLGKWILTTDQVNYPEISFTGSSAIFRSKGDTVYIFEYHLKDNTITLIDFHQTQFNARIVKLTTDSLIFSRLVNNKSIQRYYRGK